MEKYYGVIKKNFLFTDYDDDRLKKALSLYRASVSEYKKNELLFVGVKRLERFGVVLSGSVQVSLNDIDGNKMIMANVGVGLSFGESICFLKIDDSGIYIEACEDSSILWLNPDGIDDEMKRRFTAMIARRTLSMNMRIQILSKLTIRDKLLTFFSEMSDHNGKHFKLSMSREDMALYLGTNRSALSRELSKMKSEGIIDYHGSCFEILV